MGKGGVDYSPPFSTHDFASLADFFCPVYGFVKTSKKKTETRLKTNTRLKTERQKPD